MRAGVRRAAAFLSACGLGSTLSVAIAVGPAGASNGDSTTYLEVASDLHYGQRGMYARVVDDSFSCDSSPIRDCDDPTGHVDLWVDYTLVESRALEPVGDGESWAQFEYRQLSPGQHTVKAYYRPGSFRSSEVTKRVDVGKLPYHFTLSQSSARSFSGQAVRFTMAIPLYDPELERPLGRVKLYDNDRVVREEVLVFFDGSVVFDVSSLTPGDHDIRATYDGDWFHRGGETKAVRHHVRAISIDDVHPQDIVDRVVPPPPDPRRQQPAPDAVVPLPPDPLRQQAAPDAVIELMPCPWCLPPGADIVYRLVEGSANLLRDLSSNEAPAPVPVPPDGATNPQDRPTSSAANDAALEAGAVAVAPAGAEASAVADLSAGGGTVEAAQARSSAAGQPQTTPVPQSATAPIPQPAASRRSQPGLALTGASIAMFSAFALLVTVFGAWLVVFAQRSVARGPWPWR